MNKRFLGIGTGLTAAALSGCVATPPTQSTGAPLTMQAANAPVAPQIASARAATQATPSCKSPELHVTINQVNISASRPTIKVKPGEKFVKPKGAGIRWNFSGNAYSFTEDGISFDKKDSSGNSIAQPYGPIDYGPGNNATEFVVCFGDTSAARSTWRYNIRFFENDKPTIVWICDPTLVNSSSESGAEEEVPCRSTSVVP